MQLFDVVKVLETSRVGVIHSLSRCSETDLWLYYVVFNGDDHGTWHYLKDLEQQ